MAARAKPVAMKAATVFQNSASARACREAWTVLPAEITECDSVPLLSSLVEGWK
jgi:hypothetical protein